MRQWVTPAPNTRAPRSRPGRAGKARSGPPIDPWFFFATLRRGWRALALATLAGLAVGGAVATFAMPSTYESEAVLAPDVDADGANPFAREDALHEGAQLIEHPMVLTEVRDRLGLRLPIERLDERVDAETDREAGVIRVQARASSSTGAAGLASTLIDTFLSRRRESEAVRLRARAAARRAELESAQASLRDARAEYDRFRAAHGITDLAGDREHAVAEAARLSAEASEESVAATSAEARMRVLREEARRIPRMRTAAASRSDVLGSELAQARAELAQLRARYTQSHPAIQALQGRIAELERSARSGTRAVTIEATSATNPVREELEGSIALAAADRATAEERRTGLALLAERARERVQELSAIEGQASLLLAAVRVGEQQIERLRTEIATAEDRAGDPPPGFHVAAAPLPPELPLSSREKKLVWILTPLAGFLIAFAVVFWRSRGGARARSANEVAWWGDAPVVGTTERPPSRGAA